MEAVSSNQLDMEEINHAGIPEQKDWNLAFWK
jgi:hypothetical protein